VCNGVEEKIISCYAHLLGNKVKFSKAKNKILFRIFRKDLFSGHKYKLAKIFDHCLILFCKYGYFFQLRIEGKDTRPLFKKG
jgi:hypothetical protein